MLYLYPSNRLEDLAILLAEVIKTRPRNILKPINVLVPNPGMQHWLNMQLCDHLGISMNIECPMPTRYIWDLCREVLGDDSIPQKSPYKREILSWKIYQLCQSSQCEQADFYPTLSLYWVNASSELDKQRRIFSFARQLADLFEQYLVFRPDWLQQWEKEASVDFSNQGYQQFEQWQKWFWLELNKWIPSHPVSLQLEAIAALGDRTHTLPEDIYIFSINSISPIYLTFFDEISQHTNLHLFQLNPCVNYWGDAQSDLAIAKFKRKQALDISLDEDAVHPLLRNLGAQGRDLNNLLADMQHQEIAAFNVHQQPQSDAPTLTLLQQLQHDILSGTTPKQAFEHDNSIAVHACHSEVRELQVLKDVLLDKFSHIPNLQPKDILVMCPSIEAYSPYIRSVFTQSSQPALNLPVSISDRQPIESQSYIVAFMQLLSLPTARFDATGIVDLISLPALADKYQLSPQDIDLCAAWLNDAAVDWGKDAEHIAQQIHENVSDDTHTWHWGISRLLIGMINAVNDTLVDGYCPIAYVEGQATLVLGKFLQALEALEQLAVRLSSSQSISQWTQTLLSIVEDTLSATQDDSFAKKLLVDAIYNLDKNAMVANFEANIELPILDEALRSILSIPEVRSQFYSGNITFCSMLPMRSIPFKVIAILGLNQSDFPRQDTPVEIDLMQASAARKGDRSRRGDDRYLFLESIVSARQYLHLSFQYRHIKNNSVREPSLVVKMLVDYCLEHYGQTSVPIVEHALHPFSTFSFMPSAGYNGSFDSRWFACLQDVQRAQQNEALVGSLPLAIELNTSIESVTIEQSEMPTRNTIDVRDLVRFVKNTLPYYAKNVLGVYLDEPTARDYMPVYGIDGLTQYSLRFEIAQMLKQNQMYPLAQTALTGTSANDNIIKDPVTNTAVVLGSSNVNTQSTSTITAVPLIHSWQHLKAKWLLSGKLPFLIGIEDDLDHAFIDTLTLELSIADTQYKRRAKGQLTIGNITLAYDIAYDLISGLKIVRLNPKAPSLRHFVEPWIQYLVLLVHLQNDEEFQQLQKDKEQKEPVSKAHENANIGQALNEYDNHAINQDNGNDLNSEFGVHIHYIEPNTKKSDQPATAGLKQIKICQLLLSAEIHPIDALSKILSVYGEGCQAPILIDLGLAEDVMKFASAEEALGSKALMAKWVACNQASDNRPDLFPHTYFNYLLGVIPAFEEHNVQLYFDCFGAIEQIPPRSISVDISHINTSALFNGRAFTGESSTGKSFTGTLAHGSAFTQSDTIEEDES